MGKMKKFVIGTGVTIGLLGMIGACGDSETTTTTTTPAKVEQKQEVKKPVQQYNIGDSIKAGDVIFTITKKQMADNVGGQYGTDASGKFLILDAVVKNEGKAAITISGDYFKIKSGDTEYSQSDDASIYLEGNKFIYEEINPGIEYKGKLVFDIPEDVAASNQNTLTVQDSGFWPETGTINLK